MSARAVHRAMRVARTIANLTREECVSRRALAEALQYRAYEARRSRGSLSLRQRWGMTQSRRPTMRTTTHQDQREWKRGSTSEEIDPQSRWLTGVSDRAT